MYPKIFEWALFLELNSFWIRELFCFYPSWLIYLRLSFRQGCGSHTTQRVGFWSSFLGVTSSSTGLFKTRGTGLGNADKTTAGKHADVTRARAQQCLPWHAKCQKYTNSTITYKYFGHIFGIPQQYIFVLFLFRVRNTKQVQLSGY